MQEKKSSLIGCGDALGFFVPDLEEQEKTCAHETSVSLTF